MAVDHGKTTLVDQLLRQSGTLKRLSPQEQLQLTPAASASSASGPGEAVTRLDNGFITRVMDSNDLEKERGITILSKCTSIMWKGTQINIVDTPGHADFGGEVERIMSMVDSVALVVDATEGPMTQTRFVLSKALERGLKPVVVLNKADRPTSRPAQVESDLFDLFATLGATDEQMDYPVMYASAKQGWAQLEAPALTNTAELDTEAYEADPDKNMKPLLDLILSSAPAPSQLSRTDPFSMLTVQLESDPYLGTLYLGRIHSGEIKIGDEVVALAPLASPSPGSSAPTPAEGPQILSTGKIKKIFSRLGLERIERPSAGAGEIVSLALSSLKLPPGTSGINLTFSSSSTPPSQLQPLPSTPISPPTISTFIYPNDSPFAGKEGNKLTSQVIRDRLYKEAETNVALRVLPGPTTESLELRGRGILHLGVLFEQMRREGFEFAIGPPKAVLLPNPEFIEKGWNINERTGDGMLEPIEECVIRVKEEYAGSVIEKLTLRKGEMMNYASGAEAAGEEGYVRIDMEVPARGLIGYMAGEFKNDVHGEGTLNHIFSRYAPYSGPIASRRSGSLICMAQGESSAYAMAPLQARALGGGMFISPGMDVYPGLVIGETNRTGDLQVNPTVKKQLTNIRAAGADDKIVLAPPKQMTLEEYISFMEEGEVVEVTPKSVRLRKVNFKMRGKAPGGGKK
ncbi:hypothetical protein D9758_009863 [Tetrapyrgos nigripes]|uniref:Tr-type G domain-containing protein n=1 Tax=Tetrapyrgos nigripes TaxID=182062 RepID=A0A8H5GMY3_9AGAR|nr:hypothetical protein D9758_009863 [Tetrapyrgos nigripes]